MTAAASPTPRRRALAAALVAAALLALAATALLTSGARPAAAGPPDPLSKIQHVVIVMQENRSFDSYFGTYPGARGIPMKNGVPKACLPNPREHNCVRPYHDSRDRHGGGPHGSKNAKGDIDGGKMDGFIKQAYDAPHRCKNPNDPVCTIASSTDVMGYHDQREIPNYWQYASQFVLQDMFFESNSSWSLPAHLFMVSGWSAHCKNANPFSCRNAITGPENAGGSLPNGSQPRFAWTDVTYLLNRAGVSWRYYVFNGKQPDCVNEEAIDCEPEDQKATTPSIWNPLPNFTTVKQNRQRRNVQTIANFFKAANTGTLPAVSWVVPNNRVSEHPPSRVSAGQEFVTSVVNAVMRSANWESSVILLGWDDWGGMYDHVRPPIVDRNGYGLRVPSMVISPYAKQGHIDHQVMSFDAYLKFIEDVFLGGQRLDPATDGRPDPRPTVRETVAKLGDLREDLDLSQPPRPPLLLDPLPPKRQVR